jgi:hypothetical protein
MLENYHKIMGDKKFVTFMSESVASCLGNVKFTDMLEHWRLILGDE